MAVQKPILIIGAGLSGLVTARLLTEHGIPVIVFEQSSPDRSQGHGITIRDWAFNPLLQELGDAVSVDEFQRAVATDRNLGGTGWVDLTFRNNRNGDTLFDPDPPRPGQAQAQVLFRANRSVLRNWLAHGVDVKYEHNLEGFSGGLGHVRAVFENGTAYEGSMLVAADGVHSTTRGLVFPGIQQPEILPVILFHGKVHMSRSEYERVILPTTDGSNVAAGVGDSFNTFITLANAEDDGGTVHLDWSYSRAQQGEKDPLWMPDRAEVIKVPQHLLKEIRSRDLTPPFSTLVNADAVKRDKVYNWRIRSVYISRADLDRAAARGVVFMGDAVHAMPIFGGEGGNHAILDGVELFRGIKRVCAGGDGNGKRELGPSDIEGVIRNFYDEVTQRGQDAVRRCVQRFSGFHKPINEWLKVAEMAKRKVGDVAV